MRNWCWLISSSMGTYLIEIFSVKKMHLKMLSAKYETSSIQVSMWWTQQNKASYNNVHVICSVQYNYAYHLECIYNYADRLECTLQLCISFEMYCITISFTLCVATTMNTRSASYLLQCIIWAYNLQGISTICQYLHARLAYLLHIP